jgi:urocanate hydratase
MSGHPQGLYPSTPKDPRMVVTNGMMVPNYSTKEMYDKLYANGSTIYGQMTAGSFCYIGSQGIVHGTTLTLLNAARKYLGKNHMKGVVYVTSGLGGMSGAQPKAGDICGCISVTAEVIESALDKRIKQGWVKEKITDL